MEGLVLSDVVHCIEVATVDTTNRTNSSDPVCFVFNGIAIGYVVEPLNKGHFGPAMLSASKRFKM